jgi:hypothetical protein
VLDRSARRSIAVTTLTVLAALVLSACGGAATSSAPAAAPSQAPASATAAPTPSPSAVDVAAAFIEQLTDPSFNATAKIDGTMTVGPVEGAITGDGVVSGANSSMTLAIDADVFKQTTETIHVGGTAWSRKDDGPWLEDPAKPAGTTNQSLGELLQTTKAVTDAGVEARGGKQLHHLRPSGGNTIPPAVFGVDPATAKDAKFSIDFYATEDGTPAVVAIAGTWTSQGAGGVTLPTEMAFDITFDDVGEPQVINPPEDVWVRYTSKALGYTMAHPADWTVETKKGEDTYLLNDQGYVYVATTPYKGSTAKFVTDLKASYKKPFQGNPASETPTRLGGQPAVRLVYDYTNDQGQAVTIADDVISRDGTGWEVFLATAGGHEDIAVFDQFVSTFEFTD